MKSGIRWALGACVLLELVPVASHAVTFGMKAGIALTDVTPSEIMLPSGDGDDVIAQLELKRGPVGGVFATWEVSDRIAMQAEALYVSKGLAYGKDSATHLIYDYL